MEWLIDTLLSMILVTDVRSPDPAAASMRRARLGMIVCAIGEVVFLALAFAMLPDEAAVSPVRTFQDLVSRLYAAGAVCSMMGLAWFTWRAWRAYTRPDLYIA